MAKEVLHVVPHDQAWAVKREGNERASSTHPTQKDAIEAARELAKEQDDIVIHRADGTIRERVTYYGAHEQPTTHRATELDPSDVVGVGSRVSWQAVLAGAVVAMATFVTLWLLALAIGLSTVDQMRGRTFAVSAAVVSGLILLASLFLGGYVASRTTAGERPVEAAAYGVLVWGAMLLLFAGGVGFALPGAAVMAVPMADVSADRVKQELRLTDQQAERYAAIARESRGLAEQTTPQAAAWWAFGSVALSLIAAIAGGLTGCGPRLVAVREPERPTPVVVPRPA